MNGADILVKELMHHGVTFVTTLSGTGLSYFYVACKQAGMPLVDFRNEQAAAYAADAAARLTRRVGVCAVSAAVGHVGALPGVLNAWFDGSPVLLISGASEHSRTDMGKFQELDHIPLAAPICKYARLVDRPERIPFYVREAFARATTGRPGPVHLTVPVDVLSAEICGAVSLSDRFASGEVCARAAADPSLIGETVALLERAERPLVIAGSGSFYANAGEALETFAATLALPVVVPIWDRGVVSRPRAHYLGVIGAASGEPELVSSADLLLLLGARWDYRLGYGEPPHVKPDAKIVRIDADAGELSQGRSPDISLLADPASALAALQDGVARRQLKPKSAWLDEARNQMGRFRARWSGPVPPCPPITGRHVVEAIRPFLARAEGHAGEPLLLIDGGNIGQWAHVLLADRYPSHWLTCGASGVVGWGLGGAIGAKLALPDRPVILLCGDGAIGFNIAELETAARHDIPFVVVLADDRAWGIIVSTQMKRHGSAGVIASELTPVAFDAVAEGFGARGVRVVRVDDIGPAIAQGLSSGRPTLIHVPIARGGPTDF